MKYVDLYKKNNFYFQKSFTPLYRKNYRTGRYALLETNQFLFETFFNIMENKRDIPSIKVWNIYKDIWILLKLKKHWQMTKLYLEEVSMQKVSICRIKKTVEKMMKTWWCNR